MMRSPFKFAQHGQCGTWVSDAMPHLAGEVDDLAFIRSMYTTNLTHEPAMYMIQTGKMGAGPADARGVGRLRPGQREPEPAGLRRARRSAGPAGQRRRELAGRLSAAGVPGHAVPLDRLAGAEPEARSRPARERREGGTRAAREARHDAQAAAARPADARRPHRQLRTGRPHATGGDRRARPREGTAATFRRCTASAASRPTPTAAAA